MSADIAQRTIAVIANFKSIPEEDIALETTLAELDLDSLDGLNLIFELEEEFDIAVPDDKALSMKTVRELTEGIERLLAGEVPEAETPDSEPNAAAGADSVNAEGSQ